MRFSGEISAHKLEENSCILSKGLSQPSRMEAFLSGDNNKLPLFSLAFVCAYALWREISDPVGDELSELCNQWVRYGRQVYRAKGDPQEPGASVSQGNKHLGKSSAHANAYSLSLEVYEVVFDFLTTRELNTCALVCFLWRDASR